jgi:hypothetical protein
MAISGISSESTVAAATEAQELNSVQSPVQIMVNGEHQNASMVKTDAGYQASYMGVTASGSSEQMAELNLENKLLDVKG